MIQTDEANVHAFIWPRCAAAAERFWSPRDLRDVNAAAPRLEAWRCRMLQRGIQSGPTTSSYCPTPSTIGAKERAAAARAARGTML
jgi:hexosaminidase